MRLAGKHAVVTGGGVGIGAAIARALSAEGAALTLIGRRLEPLVALAAKLPRALATVADVTNRVAVDQAFAAGRDAHGPIDILVNNAGVVESGSFASTDFNTWRQIMSVNVDALHHCCQGALGDLRKAEAGRIVTIASTAGLRGYAYTAAYVAAKHAAIGLTRALAAELANTAITVNAVCPGFTDTEMVARAIDTLVTKAGRTVDAARNELARFNPQGRLIEPEEVAETVIWLCLPANRSITGQSLVIAGGEVT